MMYSPTFLKIAKEAGFARKALDAATRCQEAGTDEPADSDMDASFRLRWFAAQIYYADWLEAMDLMCSNRRS
jgi:hypothetical protein